MLNTAKPTTVLANSTKASFGETWETISSTWASETRFWEDLASNFNNVAVAGQVLWSARILPWRLATPWQTDASGITNTVKPT